MDSATFHRGRRLRRDRAIRVRLTAGAAMWRIVELRANDLSQGQSLIEKLRGQAH